MLDPKTPPPARYVSVAEAAEMLGKKPWDVVRLIEDARVDAIQLVEVASLRKLQGAVA